MLLRHRSTVSSTRSTPRLSQGRLQALRPSSGPEAQRNALYAVIAQHSPQTELQSLVRLLG